MRRITEIFRVCNSECFVVYAKRVSQAFEKFGAVKDELPYNKMQNAISYQLDQFDVNYVILGKKVDVLVRFFRKKYSTD